MSNASRPRSPAGFTLIELLLVTVLSALVAVGLAEWLHLFGRALQTVRAEGDSGPEEAMALMTDMARYGWSVEHPAPGRLDVVDAQGQRTVFEAADGVLRVTRPAGVSGELLHGVAALDVQAEVQRRLRDGQPQDVPRTWFSVAAGPASPPATFESGLPLALGFTMDSAVPDGFDVVDGVSEHALFASLDTLSLSLVHVESVPADPNLPISGGSGGSGGKVDICHVPPGNPDNAHTINVSVNALEAHLDHGDVLGVCEPPPDPGPAAALTVQLFEARAPDDARPVGEPLGSVTLPGSVMPKGSASWVAKYPGSTTHFQHDHGAAQCAATLASGDVIMCHVPPGNPAKAHSIIVPPAAVAAHLAHGDYFGCCGAHGKLESIWVLNLKTAPKPVELDLAALGALVQPGRAYTLVLSLTGPGTVYVASSALGSPANSGVAQAAQAWGGLLPVPLSVPFALEGLQRITRTEEHMPVARVSLALEMQDGQAVLGSASVASQANVPGEWLGTVPGELAEIDP